MARRLLAIWLVGVLLAGGVAWASGTVRVAIFRWGTDAACTEIGVGIGPVWWDSDWCPTGGVPSFAAVGS